LISEEKYMATTYTSTTYFDENLPLTIVENNTGSKTEYRYVGFRSSEEAKRFSDWWEESWYGYSPYATAAKDTADQPIVLASRWNSCD